MFSLKNNVTGDVNVAKLVGRLDAVAARDAEELFVEAAAAAPNIVLDMSELEYIASAGLRLVKRLSSDVRSNGGSLKLRGVQDEVMEVFELTGFAAVLRFE